ncbi:phage tail assembly chaperone [Sphingomonas sp. 2378]|uniref:phage tail assembly chaperone n=1 Tax=Sphingomonas sp. 2378 TaxID=1219748 RepID=UPI00311B28B8
MPPNPMPHLIERFMEMGMVEAAGMGTVALSWPTIAAWSQMTGVRLSPWEARLIRRLSVEYLAEGRRAEVETCPAPWKAPVSKAEIEAERAALERLLG